MCTYPCIPQFHLPVNLVIAEPGISVYRIQDLRLGSCWFNPPAQSIFFLRIDDNHCDRIHSTLTAVHIFNNGYVQKQPVAWQK